MARNRGTIDLESGSIPIDWATESTLQDVLKALKSAGVKTEQYEANRKKAKEDGVKANKELLDTLKKSIKDSGISNEKQKEILKALGTKLDANSKDQMRTVKDEMRKQGATFFEINNAMKSLNRQQRQQAIQESKDLRTLAQAVEKGKTATTGVKKAASAVAKAGGLTADAQGGPLAGMVAGLGAAGAGFGAMIGTMEGFVAATNNAIQTGFDFGNQLIFTRANVADIGINLGQFSEILVASGEGIRRLGDSGYDAQRNFQGLIRSALDSSEDFGYFGLSALEVAEQLGPIVDNLGAAGLSQTQMIEQAQGTFMELNKEVMGLAKLTGRDRRELLRQSQSIRADTLFQSLLSRMEPAAHGAAEKIAANFGVFGSSADTFTEMFKAYTTELETGIPTLTTEQRTFLNMYPEVSGAMKKLAEDFIADPEGAADSIDTRMTEMINSLDVSKESLETQARAFEASGNAQMAAYIGAYLEATRQSQNLVGVSEESYREAKNAMDTNAASQLKLQQNFNEIVQTFQAQFLKLFGVENFEDLAQDEIKDQVKASLNNFGDYMVRVRDFIAGAVDILAKLVGFDDETLEKTPEMGKVLAGVAGLFLLPTVVSAAAGGLMALFATTAVVKALSGAIAALFAGAALPGAAKAATGAAGAANAAGQAGKLGKGLGFLAKKLPYIGALITGGMGVIDQQYQDAGYAGLDRAALGIGEGALDLLDLGANTTNWLTNALLGTNFQTDVDTSQSFKDWVTGDTVAAFMQGRFSDWWNKVTEDAPTLSEMVPQPSAEETVMSQFVAPSMTEKEMRRQGSMTPSPVQTPGMTMRPEGNATGDITPEVIQQLMPPTPMSVTQPQASPTSSNSQPSVTAPTIEQLTNGFNTALQQNSSTLTPEDFANIERYLAEIARNSRKQIDAIEGNAP